MDSLSTSPHPTLGPLLITAQRVSLFQTARTLGNLHFLIIAPICHLFTSVMAAGIPVLLLPPAVARPIFFLAFLVMYLSVIWYFYILPAKDECALFEEGFRIRLSLKRRVIPFSEIQAVRVGGDSSARLSLLDHQHPQIAEIKARIEAATLTVHTYDGKRHTFKGLLARFQAADMERLLAELIRRNPHLAPRADTSPSC